jgi:hypothetical protein
VKKIVTYTRGVKRIDLDVAAAKGDGHVKLAGLLNLVGSTLAALATFTSASLAACLTTSTAFSRGSGLGRSSILSRSGLGLVTATSAGASSAEEVEVAGLREVAPVLDGKGRGGDGEHLSEEEEAVAGLHVERVEEVDQIR